MEFNIIPEEQTPELHELINLFVVDYIEEHREKLLAFLEYAKTRTDAVGLAANQCAVDGERFEVRAFAIRNMITRNWSLVIDPEITKYSGIKETKAEGCLTWKGRTIVAERHRQIEVDYLDMDGKKYWGKVYKGVEAQIWQHEVNHLNGVEEDVRDYFKEPLPITARRNELCPCGSGLKYKKCCLI